MRQLLVVLSFVLALPPAATATAQTAAPTATADRAAVTPAAAPQIFFAAAPALLILIDGDPIYRDVPGTELRRIVNTKALIVRNQTGIYYVRILRGWMEAYDLQGWWEVSGVPPEGARTVLDQAAEAKGVDLVDRLDSKDAGAGPRLSDQTAPTLYVSTTPATLIVTDGPPRFATLAGTSLEYVENATANVFREPTDQELYVLLSGQWFRSWRTEGPWQFVASSELPADFALIPPDRLKEKTGAYTR